jgi:hypothetical protein
MSTARRPEVREGKEDVMNAKLLPEKNPGKTKGHCDGQLGFCDLEPW